jgi:2-dehydropantoate 2-reductase
VINRIRYNQAKAGEEFTLIARGNRAAYLQEHGATITGLADFTVPVRVITDPQQVQEADVLIVTVKTYDMETALASVKHMQVGSVLSIQNGVVKNEQLADVFGWEIVLGAMAAFSAEVLPTGAVRFTVNSGFYLGELPEGLSERVQALADTVERAGVMARFPLYSIPRMVKIWASTIISRSRRSAALYFASLTKFFS